jgi:hypothetical protein
LRAQDTLEDVLFLVESEDDLAELIHDAPAAQMRRIWTKIQAAAALAEASGEGGGDDDEED